MTKKRAINKRAINKRAINKRQAPEKRLIERLSPPQWVQEMHKHFRENGFYRAEDLQRVLGDPRECVQVQASTDLIQLSRNYLDKR